MIIEMLQDDIQASKVYAFGFESCDKCPIAMTLIRHGYNDVSIGKKTISVDGNEYIADKNISDWIDDLLTLSNVNPITLEFFELTDGVGYVTIK